ncbi:MAG: rane protein [Actinomycetia bacterium]|nr:rane protein [Actinomycetes bacterium]
MVAVAYAIAQIVFVSAADLGWDETVYLSQVNPHVPTEYFSAPRSRGITLLPAPLVALTTSVPALHLYMTVLSATGLVVAFWPWSALLRGQVVALATLLFTSLWVVQFYGNEVMPNLYVAYGAVAATGWYLRAVRDDGRGPLTALGASLAFTALMRPTDAAFLVLVLTLSGLAARGHRVRVPAVIVAGSVLGAAPWLAEAYARFGGPLGRLRAADATEGGMGWHVAIGMELRSLNGPTLCRPCGVPWHHPMLSVWWLALPILVAGGLVVARETRGAVAMAVACGAVLAVPYLFLIPYAAPRFLMPTYALWALAVGVLVDRLVAGARDRARPWALLVAGLILAAQFGTQHLVLRHRVADQRRSRDAIQGLAGQLHRLGVRPPCTLAGSQDPYVAYYAGCASAAVSEDNPATTPQTILAAARHRGSFAVLTRGGARPSYLTGWRRYGYTASNRRHWAIYLPPVTS